MTVKRFKAPKVACRSYVKSAGQGWEVGFVFNGKNIFVGNFIYRNEATRWYALMNRTIRSFSYKNKVTPNFPKTQYAQFLAGHLYRTYYAFLDKLFAGYSKNWNRTVARNARKFKSTTRRTAHTGQRFPLLKAA